MRGKIFGLIVTAALGLLAAPLLAEAQQPGKVSHIGLLGWSTQSFYKPYIEVFLQELNNRGWVEGQNFVLESRFADRKKHRLPSLVSELSRLDLDVIVTITTTATKAAMQVIKTTPVVFTVVADPVDSGFVASLARPGGNATGPASLQPQTAGKRLQLFKETVPRLSRIAVFWEPTNPGVRINFRQTQRDAQKLGLTLQSLEVRSRDDFEPTFAVVTGDPPDALMGIISPLTVRYTKQIVAFALKHKLPTMAGWEPFARVGGLMSYAPSFSDEFRRAAPYVDRILKGAKPADLPVEQPTKFELVINLKTAKQIGIAIPPTVLFQATEVIR